MFAELLTKTIRLAPDEGPHSVVLGRDGRNRLCLAYPFHQCAGGGVPFEDRVMTVGEALKPYDLKSVPVTRQCAWCRRVWDGARWVLVPVPVGSLVTHGLCPECERREFGEDDVCS